MPRLSKPRSARKTFSRAFALESFSSICTPHVSPSFVAEWQLLTAMGKRRLFVRRMSSSWRRVLSERPWLETLESDEQDASRDHGDGDCGCD
jgi:hypothetical protein